MKREERRKRERGAIVVEATIALTAYIFAIFTILSIVDICYIQAKMSIALDESAKQLSQYSYLYYKFGLDSAEAELHKGTEDSHTLATNTITGLNAFVGDVKGIGESVDIKNASVDFEQLIESAKGAESEADSLGKQYQDAIGDNPTAFIIGMAQMGADELAGEANAAMAKFLGKAFMKKNLKDSADDDADAFLKRYHVVGGLSGLDMNYSRMMTYGQTNDIMLVCTYEVQVIRLLNIDFKFKFRQCAVTRAWGNGQSSKKEGEPASGGETTDEAEDEAKEETTPSVWTLPSSAERGTAIKNAFASEYPYSSASGSAYDFYDSKTNTYVKIRSMDTNAASYIGTNQIQYQLKQELNGMRDAVNNQQEDVKMINQSGNPEIIYSPTSNRQCRIVLVVPDDADMENVNQQVQQFKNEVGYPVTVEIRQGFGSSLSQPD